MEVRHQIIRRGDLRDKTKSLPGYEAEMCLFWIKYGLKRNCFSWLMFLATCLIAGTLGLPHETICVTTMAQCGRRIGETYLNELHCCNAEDKCVSLPYKQGNLYCMRDEVQNTSFQRSELELQERQNFEGTASTSINIHMTTKSDTNTAPSSSKMQLGNERLKVRDWRVHPQEVTRKGGGKLGQGQRQREESRILPKQLEKQNELEEVIRFEEILGVSGKQSNGNESTLPASTTFSSTAAAAAETGSVNDIILPGLRVILSLDKRERVRVLGCSRHQIFVKIPNPYDYLIGAVVWNIARDNSITPDISQCQKDRCTFIVRKVIASRPSSWWNGIYCPRNKMCLVCDTFMPTGGQIFIPSAAADFKDVVLEERSPCYPFLDSY